MTEAEIHGLVEAQREYFFSGATLPLNGRIDALKKLKAAIEKRQKKISSALYADLGKSETESYLCEIGMVLSELSFMLRHIREYSREKNVYTPLSQFMSRSYAKPGPYGVALMMSPWNYPFLLTIDPLVDALAAGNTAVVKPSAYSPAVSAVIEELLGDVFPREYVAVVTGGREENTALLRQSFDYIFFTGSQSVGKEVLRCAAETLTPVTLELGGKSPCIVDDSAKINVAARRIVFGKFLNCGQTCVAPDYILCDEKIEEELAAAIGREITRQYGSDPMKNPGYGKIINEKHFRRLIGLIDPEKLAYGGRTNAAALKIAPTVLRGVSWEDPVMQEEIFGPVLPILTYEQLDDAIAGINAHARPLALYFFSEDKRAVSRVTERCRFGGGCINDTVIHLATSEMGFGGVGESGMGAYHGKSGFDTFTHYKSIVDKKTSVDLPMRYQPYTRFSDKLIRLFLH